MSVFMYKKILLQAFLVSLFSVFCFAKIETPSPEVQGLPSANPILFDDSIPGKPKPSMLEVPNQKFPVAPMQRPSMPPAARRPEQRNAAPLNNEENILKVVPQVCKPVGGRFVWNFKDEELGVILQQMSDMRCINIMVNESIKTNMKLTIIGMTPITPDEAWTVLLSALSANGLALSELSKNSWTLIRKPDALLAPSKIITDPLKAAANDGVATLFYKAKHATQDTLKNVASTFISKDGKVANVSDQFIVIIDSSANLRRIGYIFEQVDVEDANNKIHIIPLINADAKVVDKQLRELFDVSPAGRPKPRGAEAGNKSLINIDKIIADERTNSLLIVTDKDSIKEVQNVIELLDKADTGENTKGKIHVFKLKFADAEKVAETLNKLVSSNSRRFGRPAEGSNSLFEGDVKVTSHKDNNALVVVANSNDYKSVLRTIEELDIPIEQVYIEGAILSLELSANSQFGVNLFSGLQQNIPGIGGSLGMFANPGGAGIVQNISTGLTASATGTSGAAGQNIGALAVLGNFVTGGVAGLVGPAVPGSNGIPSFGAVLQAMAANSNVDVLSTPYLLTSDNKEASMSVGEKVPVIKGATTGGGTASTALGIGMNITYEEVKLSFKVTPHVGADDNIRLDVKQEVSALGNKEQVSSTISQYKINEKKLETTIVLRDQQTGVIGGLISQSDAKSGSKIPFLGDIPLLGWLFKTRDNRTEKKSLLLVLTPYIIRSDDDYRKILDRKTKEREEFGRLYFGEKIKVYDKYVDYSKKSGPLVSLLKSLDIQMQKVENGGPGSGNETLISPASESPPPVKDEDIIKPVPEIKEQNSIEMLPEVQENIGVETKDIPMDKQAILDSDLDPSILQD